MDNDGTMKKVPPGDEDDWETADITSFANKLSLRPSAPSFQPRPPNQGTASSAPESSVLSPTNQDQPRIAGILSRNPTSANARHAQIPPGGGLGPSWPTLAKPNQGPEQRPRDTALVDAQSAAEDNEWFRGGQLPTSNRQIWDSANSDSAAAVPHSLTPSTPAALPPPAIKILRRNPASSTPSSRSGSGSNSSTPAGQKTMADREEEYRLARERIFGAGSGSGPGGDVSAAISPEDNIKRGGSGTGSRRSGRNSPANVNRGQSSDGYVGTGGVVGSGRQTPSGAGGGGKGVVRQPRGPGEGGGFTTSQAISPPINANGFNQSWSHGSSPGYETNHRGYGVPGGTPNFGGPDQTYPYGLGYGYGYGQGHPYGQMYGGGPSGDLGPASGMGPGGGGVSGYGADGKRSEPGW